MKDVSTALEAHLHKVREIQSCDLYELALPDGGRYYYADTDIDMEADGHIYRCPRSHGAPILKRTQTKINGEVTVDTLTVTVYADKKDQIGNIPFLKACHDGILDRATLKLSRCFFREQNIIGTVPLFAGRVEVKSAGGIVIRLEVKAKTQGLNMEFPIRRYYPQGAFSRDAQNVISSTDQDKISLVAPFIPRKEVLI